MKLKPRPCKAAQHVAELRGSLETILPGYDNPNSPQPRKDRAAGVGALAWPPGMAPRPASRLLAGVDDPDGEGYGCGSLGNSVARQ